MLQISIYLTQAMQQPIRAIAKGYSRHVTGQVQADRLLALAAKFEDQFQTGASYSLRQSRKRRGASNHFFFAHPRRGTTRFDWWLLATEGAPPKGSNETWKDAAKQGQRLNFQDRFEAVQMPAKGGAPRWTWRVSQAHYAELDAAITTAIRKRGGDDELRQLLHGIHRMPGFRGIRGQVASLRRHTVAEWERDRKQVNCPYLPPRIQGFERFTSLRTVPAELVIDRIGKGLTPFDLAWRQPADTSAANVPQEVPDAE